MKNQQEPKREDQIKEGQPQRKPLQIDSKGAKKLPYSQYPDEKPLSQYELPEKDCLKHEGVRNSKVRISNAKGGVTRETNEKLHKSSLNTKRESDESYEGKPAFHLPPEKKLKTQDESSKLSPNLLVNSNIEFDPEHSLELAMDYLYDILKEHGLLVSYQGEDLIELGESQRKSMFSKFDPESFECKLDELNLSCTSLSDQKFQIIYEILQNIQALSKLKFSLTNPSSHQIQLLSNFALESEFLQNFSFDIRNVSQNKDVVNVLDNYLGHLLLSKRVSALAVKCSLHDVSIAFEQDPLQPLVQAQQTLQDFSAKFIENSPLADYFLLTLLPYFAKVRPWRKLQLFFGKKINPNFLLFPALKHSPSLQELDLGFASAALLKGGLSQELSEIIRSSSQLKKVNLFLAVEELSENNIFNDLFSLNGERSYPWHSLEEFALTLMSFGDVEIERIIDYLSQFDQLKRVTLKINAINICPRALIGCFKRCFDKIQREYLTWSDFEFQCQLCNFTELNREDTKALKKCQAILLKQEIRYKITFLKLRAEHLPDYVDKTFPSPGVQKRSEEEESEYDEIEETDDEGEGEEGEDNDEEEDRID